MLVKQCHKCGKKLPISNFYRHKKSRDGYSPWCNQCTKDNVKKHRQNPEYRIRQQKWNNKWRFRPENREKVLEIRRKSQNKINATLRKVGFITAEIRQAILVRDGYKCLACGEKKNLTMDHITSLSMGGRTKKENLQTLCRSCNSRKQSKTIDYRN